MIETSAELAVIVRQVHISPSGQSARKRQAVLARMAELVAIFEHSADEVKRLAARYNGPQRAGRSGVA